MNSILSVTFGGLAAMAVYWTGAVIALLAMRGMPLGSAGGPATPAEITFHLGLGAVAMLLGAVLTAKLSRTSPRVHVGALGLLLGIGALVGFGKPTSQWPPWFGVAMAALGLGVAAAVLLWLTPRS